MPADIRKYMQIIENNEQMLTEMPQLIPPVNFNLNNTNKNKEFAAKLLKKKKIILEENSESILFMTGDGNNEGYFSLYNKDDDLIDYLIRYEVRKHFYGLTVTQVVLWRRQASLAVGLTTRVFYDYLLEKWNTITSDKLQTELGKRFWEDRLAESVRKGYYVGLIDWGKRKINWFDSSREKFSQWLMNSEGWGTDDKFQYRRYIISKIKPDDLN